MIDATLLELLKEVRWKTLKLLEGVDAEQSLFTPPGLNNHILWHAGHSLVVVEYLCCMPLSNAPPQYPPAWTAKFGAQSKPAEVAEWPPLADVVASLIDQRTRLIALLDAVPPADLDRIIGPAPRNRTLRGNIVHGLHDEAGHQGEIYLMKKLWTLRG